MADAHFVYHGPPVLIVALGITVEDGWTGKGPDVLRHSAGFSEVEKAPKAKPAPAPETDGGES